MTPLLFTARVVSGAGRGRVLGTPTLNLALEQVPKELQEGIYACRAFLDGSWQPGALHYGPRPVFKDSVACEVHLLDTALQQAPASLEVKVVAYLREIRDFPTVEALQAQIADDITRIRAILGGP
jgi:riboflavin kinase/FMN adenylyltransferase